ncbi:MAG: hypothetical protein HFG45_01895 [Oscillospiraceae bacterium]|jgi:YbbR domain-containing protein|nr:hypothetical protein [Oscillospiraceae bacterium]
MKMNRIKEFYNSKYFSLVVSLLIAIVLWVYVTNVEETTTADTYRGIPVYFVNAERLEERGLIIGEQDYTSISAKITGSRREMTKFNASDLKVEIDVSEISQASTWHMSYKITFPPEVDTSDFVIERHPEVITFNVVEKATKLVEVRGSFTGGAAEGYVVESDDMTFSPAFIKVSGTSEELAQIAYAQVAINGQDLNASIQEDRPYTFVNADGEEVEATHVTADVDVVNVTVPVSVLKELDVAVDIISGGGAHGWDCDIDIQPKRVTLSGTVEELAAMNRLNVGAIDLSEHADDFEIVFPIELDEGIECVTGETEVRVSVRFKDLVTQDFEVTDLRYINCADGNRASIVNKTLPVTIRAAETTMEKITAGDIRVIADLADYGTMTGYVTVPVKIYVDGVTGAGAVGEYSVTVNLTSK